MKPDIAQVLAANKWSPTTYERLMAKVEKRADGCWVYSGSTTGRGYGCIYTGPERNQRQRTHRVAYLLLVGPIPDGLVLDHLCRNRACCNPEHLEPVTVGENNIRGTAPEAVSNGDTCRNGLHPWPASAMERSDGWLRCRECQNETHRRSRRRLSERSAS